MALLRPMSFVSLLRRRLDELRQGLGIPLSENDRRLSALRGIHRGQRAFVIGNGPSLSMSDLDRLTGEISFACNKIYLAYDATAWRPTYYSVYDLLVARNNRDRILRVGETKIFGAAVRDVFPSNQSITYVADRSHPSIADGVELGFSRNLFRGTFGGWTTIYFQLQVAYFMGIHEVYLTGLDFHFEPSPETDSTTEHGEPILRSEGETNHFHPEYRAKGETWSKPELGLQRRAFESARKAFEAGGGLLANASRRTALDVLPRVDFDDLFPTGGENQRA